MREGRNHRWLLSAILAVLFVFVGTVPAGAHAELESSNPADGASLKTAPKRVLLEFGEDLLDGANAVTATATASGQRLDLPDPVVKGATVSVAWPVSAAPGKYRVAFRVVSADGHPVTGNITFSYDQARVAASGAIASASAQPEPSASQVQGPSVTDSAQALAPTPEKAPLAPAVVIGVIAVGVLALAALGIGAWHTRRGL